MGVQHFYTTMHDCPDYTSFQAPAAALKTFFFFFVDEWALKFFSDLTHKKNKNKPQSAAAAALKLV